MWWVWIFSGTAQHQHTEQRFEVKFQTDESYSFGLLHSVIDELLATEEFDKLSRHDDETEHSIELHLPYIAKVMER